LPPPPRRASLAFNSTGAISFFEASTMVRTKISSTDLNWIIQEKLRLFDRYPFHGIPIAIVPDPKRGWTALMTQRDRKRRPEWVHRVDGIQKALQKTYKLAHDR